MELDQDDFERHLWMSRLELGITFDPAKHPRDLKGRWRELAVHLSKRGTTVAWANATPDVKVGYMGGNNWSIIGPKGGQYHENASSPEEVAKKVAKLTAEPEGEFLPGVSDPVDAHHIARYQDASWSLNKKLREGAKLQGKNKDIADALDRAMESNKTKRVQTRYRSVPADYAKGKRIGQSFDDGGFLSTAGSLKDTFGYGQNPTHSQEAKAVMQIKIPKGTGFVEAGSGETIFPRGSTLRITGRRTEVGPYHRGKITVLEVELVL